MSLGTQVPVGTVRCALAQIPTGSESSHGVVAPQPASRTISASSKNIFVMARDYMGLWLRAPKPIIAGPAHRFRLGLSASIDICLQLKTLEPPSRLSDGVKSPILVKPCREKGGSPWSGCQTELDI
jgi:hypothetical protein